MRRISEILFFSVLLPVSGFSQEVIYYLPDNPVAKEFYSCTTDTKKSDLIPDTVELPFIDDFSDSYIEPKPALWSDNYAFINSSYAVNPPTVGVATLDALNFDGSHYPDAGSYPYQADYLTSKPVNLDYDESDSLYLSFYYQPGGIAEPPETGDSLILDFFAPDSSAWNTVWSAPGSGELKDFMYVLVKIDSSAYLKKGFRFRFRNYASQLSSPDRNDMKANADLWHLDYISLGKNRSVSDTVQRDVAFVQPVKTILKDYFTIPWTHFEAAYNTQRTAFIDAIIGNRDTISRNFGTYLEIRDLYSSKSPYKIPVLNNDIASGDTMQYKYSYNYIFNFGSGDSAAYDIKFILQTDNFDFKKNDTLHLIQQFYDYYALDDGTAEASYGLRGSGTKNASSALKFNSFTGDTLRAVDFYFVHLVDSVNLDYYFYLNVWADNNGKPGIKLVDQIGMKPEYSGSLNKFVRYNLESPVYLEGAFYIGFTQTVEKLLNVGLDLNRANQARIFNNLDNGTWNSTTVIPGTPMMRPVFHTDAFMNTDEIQAKSIISVFPNPADQIFNISLNGKYITEESYFELIDISGKVVRRIYSYEKNTIPASDLGNGLYLLRYYEPGTGKSIHTKLIISH